MNQPIERESMEVDVLYVGAGPGTLASALHLMNQVEVWNQSHPGHEIAKRQMTDGFGGMMSFCVQGGAAEAKALATGLELFVPATSLGGVESLVEHRATVEGPLSRVQPNLLRLSVGIEDVGDLIADLEQALAAV